MLVMVSVIALSIVSGHLVWGKDNRSGLKTRDIGVIISDHNVEQTLEIVDRAYIMYEGRIRVSGTVSELVWNDEVAEIYLGPTLTARMRERFARPTPENLEQGLAGPA